MKKPEKIPIPEAESGKPQKPRRVFEEPYFITLQKQRGGFYQSFDERRKSDRLERIKTIQQKRNSKVITYYSVELLNPSDAKLLLELLQSIGKQDRLDLLLVSPGGYIDPAFKIAKLCRNFAKKKFSVIIPYYAKSAATLLCLGADELVMGQPSEIGPIDPRIRVRDNYGRWVDVSATAIKDALKVIEDLSGHSVESSLKYMPLIESINLDTLGEYERALKASKQYAIELLQTSGLLKDKDMVEQIAENLATGYYSHGYAIYAQEARDKLKFNVHFVEDEKEWATIWQLYNLYESLVNDSKTQTTMIPTIFESEEFFAPITKPLQQS